jgi:hypothetical protein
MAVVTGVTCCWIAFDWLTACLLRRIDPGDIRLHTSRYLHPKKGCKYLLGKT